MLLSEAILTKSTELLNSESEFRHLFYGRQRAIGLLFIFDHVEFKLLETGMSIQLHGSAGRIQSLQDRQTFRPSQQIKTSANRQDTGESHYKLQTGHRF